MKIEQDVREYQRRHRTVRKVRGSARLQLCAGNSEHCTGQAESWATLHERDGLDPLLDYLPLCVPCHVTYDYGSYRPQAKIHTRYTSGHYHWCVSNCTRKHRKLVRLSTALVGFSVT